MSNILVTGGAGFIASNIVDNLVNDHNVVVLDDLSGGFIENVNPKAKFINGSIVDADLIDGLFEEHKFDYVFHLAAYAAEGLSHFIRRFNYTQNINGSVNLINSSIKHKIKCFVFFSSTAVYGKGKIPFLETDDPHPEDPYGIAKYAIELDLEAAHNLFGLNSIIFRPFNVYGVRQNIDDRYRNLVGVFINQVMSGKPLSVFGDGLQTRVMTYVTDIAPLVAKSIEYEDAYNQIFNIGAKQSYSINDVANSVINAYNHPLKVNHMPERFEVKHTYCDTTKGREMFGDYENTPLEEGVKKMVEWASARGINEPKYFDNIEIMDNIPEIWIK